MKKFFLLASALIPLQSYAFFCPNNYNQINIGDTIEQVAAVCGAPASEEKIEEEASVPQEWAFYLPPQNSNFSTAQQTTRTTSCCSWGSSTNSSGAQPQQATNIKMVVAISAEGKVTNLSLNGQSMQSTLLCGNPVQLGMTIKQLKNACGNPSFINKSDPLPNQQKPVQKTIYKYNSTPPVSLVFTDGKLSSRE